MSEAGIDPRPDATIERQPHFRLLTIKRFRGLAEFIWRPKAGVNIILGGGDIGKSTVLDAIAMLLSPTNNLVLADTDYTQRNSASGFEIEAVISLPGPEINQQAAFAWPWDWDGENACLPPSGTEESPSEARDPVYVLRARGTDELDLIYEVVAPSGETSSLTPSLRRAIGLVRLGGDDRNDRDLRLVQGSALDRLLSDKTLRARLAKRFSEDDVKDDLVGDAPQALIDLNKDFQAQSLPSELGLGLNVGPGSSVSALIGLTASNKGVMLPVASWGAGTRRLAALTIANACKSGCPITIVDEIERGLEPYRQRAVMKALVESGSQVFITTHSGVAVAAGKDAALWYMDPASRIGLLDHARVRKHQQADPELFLSRLAIICEGATERGFVTALLERLLPHTLPDLGIKITDAVGNDECVLLLKALSDAGICFGGFGDRDNIRQTTWDALKDKHGAIVFQWASGSTEENIIRAAADHSELAILIDDADQGRHRLGTLKKRLMAEQPSLSEDDISTFDLLASQAGARLVDLMVEAATSRIPDGVALEKSEIDAWKQHHQRWYKSESGGHELAQKALGTTSILRALQTQLKPFVDAVRDAVGVEKPQ